MKGFASSLTSAALRLCHPYFFCLLFALGIVLIHVSVQADGLNPQDKNFLLFGESALPSFGCILIFVASLGTALYALRRQGVDRVALILFTIAAFVSMHFFHNSANTIYTNDWTYHLAHTEFINTHWLEPYGYLGKQDHHPPLYFYAAAVMIWFAQALGTVPALSALRFLSWLSYLVFNAFGLLTVRRAGLPGRVYHVCAALFLLWPAGFHLASKISNEPFYYASYAIAFYYILAWYQERGRGDFIKALLLAGVAFMARSNAVILFGIIALLIMVQWRRQRFTWREITAKEWCYCAAALGVCALVNFGSVLFQSEPFASHWGWGRETPLPVGHFFDFNYSRMLSRPFNDWSHSRSIWDFLLKTSIFGEYSDWQWPGLATLLDILLTALIALTFLPWLVARREEWKGMMPFIAGLAIPILFVIVFSVWKQAPQNHDARLIYPALPCLAIWFGRSQVLYKSRGTLLIAALGPIVAWAFVVASVLFFWGQTR